MKQYFIYACFNIEDSVKPHTTEVACFLLPP